MSVSTSQNTISWFCVIVFTVFFYSLFNVCQYLTLYRLLVLCHYVHCSLLDSSTVCRYVTLYRPLFVCLSVHFCVPQSVHCLSVPHTVPSFEFVALCPLLSSTAYPWSLIISHLNFFGFCFTISTVVLYSLSTVCQYHFLTLTRLLITLLH